MTLPSRFHDSENPRSCWAAQPTARVPSKRSWSTIRCNDKCARRCWNTAGRVPNRRQP